MRSRKEIEGSNAYTMRTSYNIEKIEIELLLDIRDLLVKSAKEKKDLTYTRSKDASGKTID